MMKQPSTEPPARPKATNYLDLDAVLRWIIKGILENRVLTQLEICAITGVSRSSLTHWLARSERTLTLSTASKLIGLMGLRKFVQLAACYGGSDSIDGPNLDILRQQHRSEREFKRAIAQGVMELHEQYRAGGIICGSRRRRREVSHAAD
jgi:transcriptional regulator with XRE-family HTH domain